MQIDYLRTVYIDINCSIGHWPTRPLPITTVDQLASHMRSEAIDLALTSPIEAALLEDPLDVSFGLAEAAAAYPAVIPVPVINPRHRRWIVELRSLLEATGAPAVKVHLNYHNTGIDEPEFEELASALDELDIAILMPLRIEDERLSNARLQAPPVLLPDVIAFAGRHPSLRIFALNAYRREVVATEFPGNLYTDIAFIEYYRTIESLMGCPGLDRVVYGSNTPFFVTRAASMKLACADIDDESRSAIASHTVSMVLNLDTSGVIHD